MRPIIFRPYLVLKVTKRTVILKQRLDVGCFSVFGGLFVVAPFYAAHHFHQPMLYVGGIIAVLIVLLFYGVFAWEIWKGPLLVFDRTERRLKIPRKNLSFVHLSEVSLLTREEDEETHEEGSLPLTGDVLYLCRGGPGDPQPIKIGAEYLAGAMGKHLHQFGEFTGIRTGVYLGPVT